MAAKPDRLRRMAVVTAGLHLAGLAVLALLIRPGSPLAGAERIGWIAGFPVPWMLGWGVWMLCALAFLGFALGLQWERPDVPGLRAVVALAFVGAAVDLSCDVLLVGLLPLVARTDTADFETIERGIWAAGLVAANGAYTLAVLAATRAVRRQGLASRPTLVLAGITVAGGAALVVAGLVDAPRLAAAGSAPAVAGYALWALLVAHDLRPRATPESDSGH